MYFPGKTAFLNIGTSSGGIADAGAGHRLAHPAGRTQVEARVKVVSGLSQVIISNGVFNLTLDKAKALRVLRSRLYDIAMQEQQKAIAQNRKSQVGTGDRSE